MSQPRNPIVLIPARMASTRLPNKPLADICGEPMIVQVWKRAIEADLGPVAVAAAEPEIIAAVEAAGGRAVLTDPAHPSGSDRIFEALSRLDPDGRHDAIVNVQGDLPTIERAPLRAALAAMDAADIAITTLAAEIREAADRTNPNIVKAVFEPRADNQALGRALYFTRATAPANDGPLYHHIGLYAYRRAALERFVRAAPAALERREKLEQLRALALGMRIEVALVDTVPLGVDTQAELEKARAILAARGAG